MNAIGIKHKAFLAFLPPVEIIRKKEIVEPWKLFLIWEVLRKRDKMLFAICPLDTAIIEKDDRIVVNPVAGTIGNDRRLFRICESSF